MSESAEKPCGSLALLGDYDSDEKEASPAASQPVFMETDEKTDVEVARASSAEADSEQPGSPISGPDHSSFLLDDKKSEDEFKVESSSREEEPMETSSTYRGGPCLSEDSSDDDSDDEEDNRKRSDDRKQSLSPKEEPKEEASSAVDINNKIGSPKTMDETVGMDCNKATSKSPQEAGSYARVPDSPESPDPSDESGIEEDEQGSSETVDQKKQFSPETYNNLLESSGQSTSSPKQFAGPKSHESLKNCEASPLRESPIPAPLQLGNPVREFSREDSPESPDLWDDEKRKALEERLERAKRARIWGDMTDEEIEQKKQEYAKYKAEKLKADALQDAPKSPAPSDDNDDEDVAETTAHVAANPESPAKEKASSIDTAAAELDAIPKSPVKEDPIPEGPQSPDMSEDSDDEEDRKETVQAAAKPKSPVKEDRIPDVPQSADPSDDSDDEDAEKMDTSEKPAAVSDDDEPGTSSGASGSMSRHGTPDAKPWQSPRQQPIDGVVQPRTNPPPGKPTRHTNCLDYVLFTVIKDAVKHKHSWPFQFPVDANKLEIPEYHNMITRPMDLHTIEQRIRNIYYWSAQDAIQDINQLFSNCYQFNPPEYDVYKMAKTLERQIQTQLKDLPRSEKEQEFPDHQRKAMFLVNTPNGKAKTPQKRGRKSARGRKKGPVPRSTSSFKEMDSVDDQDDTMSKVDSVNFDDDHDAITEKDEDSQSAPTNAEVEESKPSTSQPPAKKRKVENGDNGVAFTKAPTPVPAAVPVIPAPVPRKNPNSTIDWKSLPPRWKGKQTEWQKFCSKLMQEMQSHKNKSFAQAFYVPVDPIKLKIYDYLDVIKTPMDLQTIKRRLDFKQYIDPDEFVADMNLMIDNCCKYNPKGSAVHTNALELKALFDERWKLFPRPGVSKIVSDSYINQSLIVNTDLVEDERINSYLSAVKAEEKKCAEKLEQLRSMSEGLYTIAMQRREAKLAGSIAPALAPNQLTQLDKLGINISNAPIMVPELISPALSVRSSNRAPVPKIIDDIGPSPIKARKISKPRPSNASIASTPGVNPRGRKPNKSGRPRKNYSPASGSPVAHIPAPSQRSRTGAKKPYVSIYGKTPGDRTELSEKIRGISELFVHPLLRIIQLGQHDAGKDVITMSSLCDEEVDFSDAKDDLILEILDYIEMTKRDKPRALRFKDELEIRAKFYGFDAFDTKRGVIPKNKINPAQFQNRLRSDSPSPSASRRSSDSESDSDDSSDSDSEPPAPRVKPVVHKRPHPISATSSRASTPAGSATLPSRPQHKAGSSKPGYTLSEESSSSSDSNGSSDSSDSDSEPEVPQKKIVPIKEKKPTASFKFTNVSAAARRSTSPVNGPSPSTSGGSSQPIPKKWSVAPTKEPTPPPTKKPSVAPVKKPSPPVIKKAVKRPITILDELLPNTPAKKKEVPTTSSNSSRLGPSAASTSSSVSPPQEPAHDWRKLKEEHLKRKAAERAQEQDPYMDPDEVLVEIEKIYGPMGGYMS